MRVGVVGASNCILDGNFTQFLRTDPSITAIDNMSLGGSTMTLLPYTDMRHDLSVYDVVIIDVMINEYIENRGGHLLGSGLKHLRTFMTAMNAHNIACVFLIMPHQKAFETDEYDIIRIYKDAAALLGCHVIDLYEAAMAAMLRGIHPDTIWQDETHIAGKMQALVAARLLTFFKSLKKQAQFPASVETSTPGHARPPIAQPAVLQPLEGPFETLTRTSSLTSPTYMKVAVNTPTPFLAQNGSVYGLAYNSIKFKGTVHIEANGQRRLRSLEDPDAETLQHKPGFDFRHRVIPFDELRGRRQSPLHGLVTFIPSDESPADVIELECLYGGPSMALPIGNEGGFLDMEQEEALFHDAAPQTAA